MPPKKKQNKSKTKRFGLSSDKRFAVFNVVISYHDCGDSTDGYQDSDDSHSDRDYNEFERPKFRGRGVEDLAKMANTYGVFREAIADLQTKVCVNGGVVPEGKEAEFKEKCMNQYEV